MLEVFEFSKQFGEKIKILPRYYFFNSLIEKDNYSDQFIRQNCISKGKFCVEKSSLMNSLEIIEESIRQICLFNIYGNEKSVINYWREYVYKFKDCFDESYGIIISMENDCHFKIIGEFPIEVRSNLENCVNNSFENSTDKFNSKNKLLEEFYANFEESGNFKSPKIFINREIFEKDRNLFNLFDKICGKFLNKNEFCEKLKENEIILLDERRLNVRKLASLFATFCFLAAFILFFNHFAEKQAFKETIKAEIND